MSQWPWNLCFSSKYLWATLGTQLTAKSRPWPRPRPVKEEAWADRVIRIHITVSTLKMQASQAVLISNTYVFLTDFEKLNFDLVVLFYARPILCHYHEILKLLHLLKMKYLSHSLYIGSVQIPNTLCMIMLLLLMMFCNDS